jgi:hypothetical protein
VASTVISPSTAPVCASTAAALCVIDVGAHADDDIDEVSQTGHAFISSCLERT